MLNWIRRWSTALRRAPRRKARSRRREQSPLHYPALQVRLLEERRVFHAEAVAPIEAPPPPPPPPTTNVTLDADQNLLVRDVSTAGQNDQLQIRYDAESGYYEITDATQLLHTDIEGATGSGTNQLYVPIAAVSGERIIFDTGAGDDSLSVDLSSGLGGKSLQFDGGAGEADSLTLLGGSYSAVGYLFASDGSLQIDAGGSLLELSGVEPVVDYLVADSRQFTLGAGLASMTFEDVGDAADGRSLLSTSLGTSVTFASPLHSLSLMASGDGSGQSLAVTGLDASFAGDLHVLAGDKGTADFSGSIDLAGGNLQATGYTIRVSGSIATDSAMIEFAARSSLTVTAEGILENHGGQILLDAGAEGTLRLGGRIDARGLEAGQAGGTVHLLGWQVELLGNASIDVSGTGGGGTALIGGDYQGQNPLVRNATNTLVQADVVIHANGLGSADGGKIIVWADEAAVVAGSGNLQAKGGETGGDGGFIETSGKQYLEIRGAADASSPYGTAGTWLLDPVSLTIVATSSQTLDGAGSFTSASGSTQIAASTIVAALQGTDGTDGTNVTINTGAGTGGDGNITVDEEISVALGAMTTRTLTLNAHGTIDVNQAITATAGMLNVVLTANLANAGGDISLDAAITTNGGSLTTAGDTFENTDAVISTSGGNVTLNQTGAVTIAANMTLGAGTATINGASIAFSTTVAATLSAQIATLTASGAITSGMAANDVAVGGVAAAIELSGASLGDSLSPLAISPGSGTIALTAATGGIFIDVQGSDFTTEQITTLSAAGDGVTIALRVLGGNLEIDKVSQFDANTANDHFTLASTTGDVTFSANSALAAVTASVTATTGDILATSSGPHLATSGTGTAITLTSGGKIGGSGAAIGVQAGSGVVTATTTSTDAADGVYLTSTGPLTLGAIVTSAAVAQTVAVTTTGMDAHLTIAAASSTNDNWALTSSGNIAFGASGQLTATSASLTAIGTITGSSAATTDIDTSAANGTITLSGTSLGASGQPLQLSAGAGALNLSASTGGAFVNFDAGDLLTSRLSLDVQGAGQTIALSTTDGTITFNSTANFVATSDDNFVVTAGGMAKDIAFSGMTTLSGHSISLTASGAIASGTAATDLQTAATGTLTLDAGGDIGASTNPLNMQAGGAISAMAGGDIYLRQVTGNLATSAFTTLTSSKAGAVVLIGTLAGSVSVDTVTGLSLADDTLEIVAGGAGSSISFATTLAAGFIRLNAAGDIISTPMSSAVDVSAATGIESIAGGGIGAAGNPLVVQTTAGTVTATTAGAGTAGSIYLESPVALPLGGITTDAGTTQAVSLSNTTGDVTIGAAVSSNDDWILNSAGNIAFGPMGSLTANSATLTASGTITGSTGSGTDINTSAANGAITLSGTSLGAVGQPLQLSSGTGALDLTASTGGVFVNLDAGELRTSRLTLDVQAANQTIALSTSAGGVVIDSIAGFTNTADDDFQITAGGSGQAIAFSGNTTLTGRSTALTASGNITGGDAAVDIDTSALGGAITLSAGGGIGAAGSPLVVQTTAGTITASTTGAGALGSIYLQSPVALPLGAITTDATTTQTVSLTNTTGNLTIATAIASNDDWILSSAGNIAFGPLGRLTANSAALTAGGTITGSSGITTDIDTSAVNGAITLSGTSLGVSGQPLQLRPGLGALDLTASSGGVFVNLDAGDLLTSRLSLDVQGTGQTIALSTTDGAVTFDGTANFVATSDDNFVVTAGGVAKDIVFSGMTTLSGHAISLTASGAITSGTAATDVQTTFTGTLTLDAGGDIGASTNALNIQAGGAISAMAGGDVYLRQVTGNLATSAFTTLTSTKVGAIVSIGTLAGSVSVDTVTGLLLADDTLEIVTGGAGSNISFSTTLSARFIRLNAAGDIISAPMSSAVDVSAATGIELNAGGGIGAVGNPLVVQTTAGSITAITTGVGAAGSIYLESPVAVPLGGITTDAASTQTVSLSNTTGNFTISTAITSNDNWILNSAGNIGFGPLGSLTVNSATLIAGGTITGSSGSATDINTSAANGTVSLTANSLGASTAPLQLNVGTGNLVLTARTGGVFVNMDAGELRTSRLTLDVQAANQTIALSTSAGSVAIDSVAAFTNTADDDFQITAGGSGQDVAFSGNTTLIGRSIALTASGDITSGDSGVDVDTSALGGTITLSAGGAIGAATNELRFLSGGLLSATAGGDIYLRQAAGDLATSKFALVNSTSAGGLVSIGTVNGSVTVDLTTDLIVADDTLEIVAGNASGSPGDIAINAPLIAGAVRLIAAGTIQSGNIGPIDINTSALGGDITFLAGGPIGSSLTPISVSAGAGDVSATTTGAGGDIYLMSIGPLRLDTITTDAATSQTVSLATTGGEFTIAGVSATNDQLILSSSANIAFSGTGSLSAASVSLTAAGQIISGAASIDIDTAAFNGPITLNAAAIGAAGNSLVINAANAPFSVAAASGDVYLTQFSGDLALSQFTTLSLAGNNVALDLHVRDGNLLINKSLDANTQNDRMQFSAAGAGGFIVFLDDPAFLPVRLIGSEVTLTATADILNFSSFPGVPNIDTSAAGGTISLTGRSLGMAGLPLQVRPGAGNLNLVAISGGMFVNLTAGNLAASQLSVSAAGVGQTVAISTTSGHFELSGASFNANTLDDSLVIQAGGAASDITFNGTPIVANSARIAAGDSIISTQTGTDAMITGLLDLVATTGGIGAAGAGNAFTFTAGQLMTQSAGPQYLQQPLTTDQTNVVSATSSSDIFLLRGGYLVSGDIAAVGTVTIAPDVLLGGDGTVAGNRIVVAGIVDPGYFPGTMMTDGDAKTLTLVGNVTMTREATLVFDINPPYMTPGTDYDHLIVMGTLQLETPELELKGGRQLQQSINGIELVSATNPVTGMFAIGGSVVLDGRTGGIKAVVGSFRGDLIFNGPTGNGIVIGDLSLVPPIQQTGFRLPAIRLPLFTRIDRPPPTPVPPPPLAPPTEPPLIEVETEAPKLRELEVRIVVPIDDAGNFREQVVMKLPAEMLTDLPALFRRLPDDRYRIYLMLEGSAEERLVIDVVVRDGRPMEPGSLEGAAGEAAALPAPAADPQAEPQAEQHNGPAVLPALPAAPRPAAPPPVDAGDQAGAAAPARIFAGVGLAAAAVVASRRTGQWTKEVDQAAEQIGKSRQPYWRWWSRSAAAADCSRHN